jgi:hypothetical protein
MSSAKIFKPNYAIMKPHNATSGAHLKRDFNGVLEENRQFQYPHISMRWRILDILKRNGEFQIWKLLP